MTPYSIKVITVSGDTYSYDIDATSGMEAKDMAIQGISVDQIEEIKIRETEKT